MEQDVIPDTRPVESELPQARQNTAFSPKIAIAVNVHQENAAQIYECLSRIAAHLPSANVAVISNGVDRPKINEIVAKFNFAAIHGENLGSNGTWRQWWRRMLNFYLASEADVCFKLDPDTMVDAPPVAIPTADYFGYLFGEFVQGGVTGLSRNAVMKLSTSGVLAEGRRRGMPLFRKLPAQPFMDDQMLAKALAWLNIFPQAWPECRSLWRKEIRNEPVEHAIIHPRYYEYDVE